MLLVSILDSLGRLFSFLRTVLLGFISLIIYKWALRNHKGISLSGKLVAISIIGTLTTAQGHRPLQGSLPNLKSLLPTYLPPFISARSSPSGPPISRWMGSITNYKWREGSDGGGGRNNIKRRPRDVILAPPREERIKSVPPLQRENGR